MINLKIKQTDLKNLNSKLNSLKKFSGEGFSKELADTAFFSKGRMVKNVVVDKGGLKGSIGIGKKGKNISIFAKKKYAPYVEFGTGKNVDFDDMIELGIPKTYAAQFKGKGVREVNLPARPFFFSSIRVELKRLMNRLDDKLNKITR